VKIRGWLGQKTPQPQNQAESEKLIIELEGPIFGRSTWNGKLYDQERTAFLQSKGYRVLRFWNNAVLKDLNGVVAVIQTAPDE
jgi:very-short-patch-repair endonuclease